MLCYSVTPDLRISECMFLLFVIFHCVSVCYEIKADYNFVYWGCVWAFLLLMAVVEEVFHLVTNLKLGLAKWK